MVEKKMNRMKCICFLASVFCLLFTLSTNGQQNAVTKEPYRSVEVESFTIRNGVEFPPEDIEKIKTSLLNSLRNSKRFDEVSVSGEKPSAENIPRIRITGEILKYVKGNRTARYVVGLGAGKTKIIADVRVIDVKSGAVVLQQTVDGVVSWGLFGGDSDSAKGNMANDILQAMKKAGLVGEKKKT